MRNRLKARQRRFQYAGELHHIMARGDGGKAVFETVDDRQVGPVSRQVGIVKKDKKLTKRLNEFEKLFHCGD